MCVTIYMNAPVRRSVPNGATSSVTPEGRLPIREYQSGELARIVFYERANGRCPARDFLEGLDSKMANKFKGPFDAIMKTGADYCNQVRFKPLSGQGKPLWEFKEHDHRLFCHRRVVEQAVQIVLLSGWVKDKKGKGKEEEREIKRAKDLEREFLAEYPGGRI